METIEPQPSASGLLSGRSVWRRRVTEGVCSSVANLDLGDVDHAERDDADDDGARAEGGDLVHFERQREARRHHQPHGRRVEPRQCQLVRPEVAEPVPPRFVGASQWWTEGRGVFSCWAELSMELVSCITSPGGIELIEPNRPRVKSTHQPQMGSTPKMSMTPGPNRPIQHMKMPGTPPATAPRYAARLNSGPGSACVR